MAADAQQDPIVKALSAYTTCVLRIRPHRVEPSPDTARISSIASS